MMSTSKRRPPPRKGSTVVTGRFNKKPNPVEEEKPSGINVKQVVWIGALTALTGTIVGTVATEVYRHFRPKIPIPMPPQPGQVVQNPGYPQPQLPLGWAPAPYPAPQPNFAPQPQIPAFVPNVQQVGAYPVPQPQGQPQPQYVPTYVNPPALPPGVYAQAPALPPALPPAQSVPAVPQPPPPSQQQQDEPLSRPELAQWQRRLETWEHNLDRRGSGTE